MGVIGYYSQTYIWRASVLCLKRILCCLYENTTLTVSAASPALAPSSNADFNDFKHHDQNIDCKDLNQDAYQTKFQINGSGIAFA